MFSHTSQPCQFERDCAVVMVPSGDELTMPAGTVGYITQSLGGSFTVFVDGNLFRVAGVDADAIGKEPILPPTLPEISFRVIPVHWYYVWPGPRRS